MAILLRDIGMLPVGKCLETIDCSLSYICKYHNMRDFPIIKAKGKEVNKSPLHPNTPKKNTLYGVGV